MGPAHELMEPGSCVSSSNNLRLAFRDPLAPMLSPTKHVGSRSSGRENPRRDFPAGGEDPGVLAGAPAGRADPRWPRAQGH